MARSLPWSFTDLLNPTLPSFRSLPALEVMTMTVFSKFTFRPWASVIWPSSRICSSTLSTSGWAFSIRRNRVGISPKHKPVSFIFVGSTGVGKTELVKQLAEDLFNAPESLIRLDMSEFISGV